MKFDPESARVHFAQKGNDELIRVAFLEETYLQEAKVIAKDELARRGLSNVPSEEVKRVKQVLKAERVAQAEAEVQGLPIDEGMPGWRRAVRRWIAPQRRLLSALAVLAMVLLWLNAIYQWNAIGLNRSKSQGLAVLVGLFWLVFVAPSQREALDARKAIDESKN